MLRIGIDVRPALLRKAGIGRYAKNLVHGLAHVDSGSRYLLFGYFWRGYPGPGRGDLGALPGNFSLKAGPLPGRVIHLGGRIGLGLERLLGGIDVFHYTDFVFPLVRKCKKIATIYDVSFHVLPGSHREEDAESLRRVTSWALENCPIILTPSQASKKDILKVYGGDPSRVRVISLAPDPLFSPGAGGKVLEDLKKRFSIPDPYLFWVGTVEPRKNLPRVIRAFADVVKRGFKGGLVISGALGWLYEESVKEMARPDCTGRVIYTGRLGDGEIAALYRGALLALYPSLYEGFGLPVIEAMACGAPVITSRTPALAEVAGDAAVLVDAEDEGEIAWAIHTLLEDEAKRRSLSERGLLRAQKFSWHSTARETLEVYRELAG